MSEEGDFCDEWELSKENVRPRKQGRSVAVLSAALQRELQPQLQEDNANKIAQQKQLFENELRTYSGDDPLDTWHRYILWTEEAFPKGGREGKLMVLLENCVTAFKSTDQYKNDPRYIGAWIKLANFCNEPGEIFTYLFDQNIGCETAMLYCAWAQFLEEAGSSKRANKVYMEGIKRHAEPMDFLVSRHNEYQSRVVRKLMLNPEELEVESVAPSDEQRSALVRLHGKGKKKTVGTFRTGSAMSSRGNVFAQDAVKVPQKSSKSFQIYDDENVAPSAQPIQTGEWQSAPHAAGTNRENEQKPGIWSKAKIHGKVSQPVVANPSFAVYVDEDISKPVRTQNEGLMNTHGLSARKAGKPTNPLEHIRAQSTSVESAATEQKFRVMYNKGKVYCGLDEFSFEELRAAQWTSQQKQKEEIKRLVDQELKDERERLSRARKDLESLQQNLRDQFKEEKQHMMETLKQQMVHQNEHLENQRAIHTMEAQSAVERDIQHRLQIHDSSHGDSGERVTRQLNFDDLTSHGNTENIYPSTLVQLNQQQYGARPKVYPTPRRTSPTCDTSVNNETLIDRPQIDGSLNDASLTSSSSGGRQKLHRLDTLPNHTSLTAPSPTVNTREAFTIVRGMFNSSLHCDNPSLQVEESMSDLVETAAVEARPEPPSQPFTIYIEPQETSGTSTTLTDDPQLDKENARPKGYVPSRRRDQLSGCLQPSKDFSVDPSGQKEYIDVPMEQVIPNNNKPAEDNMSYIPPNDITLGPVGSNNSFAAAARFASTPCFPPMRPHMDTDDVGEDIITETNNNVSAPGEDQKQGSFNFTPSGKPALSPITEENSSDELKSSQHISQHHVTTSELCTNNPMLAVDQEGTHHQIDITAYVPQDLDEKTENIMSMSIRINPYNPLDDEEIASFLADLSPPLSTYSNYHRIHSQMLSIKNKQFVMFGADTYCIDSLISRGGFGSVYKATLYDVCDLGMDDDKSVAIKVQKPACPWEFYICTQVRQRLHRLNDPMDVSECMMSIDNGYFFNDGSCLINELHPKGSLLSMVNHLRSIKSQHVDMESVIMFLTIELLHMVEKLHKCHIIHGDIKPDNFLMQSVTSSPLNMYGSSKEEMFGRKTTMLKLIDFGRSIDMTKYPPDTTFMAKSGTDAFQCIEMMTDRPWTYQTDYFGLAGTVHVLVFLEYMKVYQSKGVWYMTGNFQRKWNIPIWKRFFHSLLNVPSCNELPDLSDIRSEFEDYFVSNLASEFKEAALKACT